MLFCWEDGRPPHPDTITRRFGKLRNADDKNTHAAVTMGGGWALHKPGQEWLCPHQVVTVSDLNEPA
jgi:hypothetical protein